MDRSSIGVKFNARGFNSQAEIPFSVLYLVGFSLKGDGGAASNSGGIYGQAGAPGQTLLFSIKNTAATAFAVEYRVGAGGTASPGATAGVGGGIAMWVSA